MSDSVDCSICGTSGEESYGTCIILTLSTCEIALLEEAFFRCLKDYHMLFSLYLGYSFCNHLYLCFFILSIAFEGSMINPSMLLGQNIDSSKKSWLTTNFQGMI